MSPEQMAAKLKISVAEAAKLIEFDKKIDRGEKLFELSADQKEAVKAMTRANSKPHGTHNRERKPDEDKRWLIQFLATTLEDADCDLDTNLDNISITNPERELEFVYNGKRYRLTMSCPRK